MSNPFSNQNVIDSNEYINKKKNISQMQSLRNRKNRCYNNEVSLCNNTLKRAKNHQNLLNFTKGYYLTKPDCFNKRKQAQNITDGRYSEFNFEDIQIRNDAVDECQYIPNYEFNKCKLKAGIVTPAGERNPEFKEKQFKLHKTDTMVIMRDDCDINSKNNECPPIFHKVDCNLCHDHYFPTNTVDIKYRHKHSDFPFRCHHHYPYPHANINSTNHYYLNTMNQYVKVNYKVTGLKKIFNKPLNVREPYINNKFRDILYCSCKQPKKCKCGKPGFKCTCNKKCNKCNNNITRCTCNKKCNKCGYIEPLCTCPKKCPTCYYYLPNCKCKQTANRRTKRSFKLHF